MNYIPAPSSFCCQAQAKRLSYTSP